MAFVVRNAPKGARRTIHAALARRRHLAPQIPSLDGSPHTGHPLPVYRIGPTALESAKMLSRARLVGWRYPLVGGKSPGLAELRKRAKAWRYAGIIEGSLPQRFLEAALLAEAHPKIAQESVRPRFLEIPALRLQALWLRSRGRDRFIVLSTAQAASALEIESGVTKLLGRAKRGKPRNGKK
jgi:hypothetical protein